MNLLNPHPEILIWRGASAGSTAIRWMTAYGASASLLDARRRSADRFESSRSLPAVGPAPSGATPQTFGSSSKSITGEPSLRSASALPGRAADLGRRQRATFDPSDGRIGGRLVRRPDRRERTAHRGRHGPPDERHTSELTGPSELIASKLRSLHHAPMRMFM